MSPKALLGLLLCTILRECSARCWIPVLCGSSQTCPPNGFNAVPNFDVKTFISAPWYPQKQIPLIYQREEDLYCVQAQYKAINPDKPAEGLYVYNTAKKGGVNGSSVGSTAADQFQLVALPDHNNPHPAKLLVGPKALSFARSLAYGPYWVVAVGNTSNASSASNSSNATLKYDWAVVSGGSPEYKSGSACSTFLPVIPTTWQYRGGLWLFTRKSVDPVASAAAAAAAQGLGFDVGKLVDVKQAGCVYPPRIA